MKFVCYSDLRAYERAMGESSEHRDLWACSYWASRYKPWAKESPLMARS